MKIGIATVSGRPTDLQTWSGTPAHLTAELRSRAFEISELAPPCSARYWLLNKFAGLTRRLGRKVNWEVEDRIVRSFTRSLLRQGRQAKCDIIVAMGWVPMVDRDGPPVIYWGDATIAQRLNVAPHWSSLSRRTLRRAVDFERRSFASLDGVVMASNWALEDAIARYSEELAYVKKVPFGANIEDPQAPVRVAKQRNQLRLLTIGVKWHRKGIDTAVRTLDELNAQGHRATLDVVGVQPPSPEWERPYVKYWGFLSKANCREHAQLLRLYRDADIFLLPTRNDPFCLVVAEAAAYGLPVVASNVGGVPERIVNGGLLLPPEAGADRYAEAVLNVWDSPSYEDFSRGAIDDYRRYTSWSSSASELVRCAREILESDVPGVRQKGQQRR